MQRCLVLPTLNEAENLPELLARLRALDPDLHVLVVDDGSTDGTAELADEAARTDPGVAVIHRRGRRGYGEAMTEGLDRALTLGASVISTMDCDFSHDPADVPRLLAALADADVVIGSRYTPGGSIRDWPAYRRALSAVANKFVRVLFRLPARDCTSGFRAYRREALAEVPWSRLHSPGYSFLVEVLYWASARGTRRVREVPICFVERRRGESKMGVREIVSGAANLLKLRWQLRGGP